MHKTFFWNKLVLIYKSVYRRFGQKMATMKYLVEVKLVKIELYKNLR